VAPRVRRLVLGVRGGSDVPGSRVCAAFLVPTAAAVRARRSGFARWAERGWLCPSRGGLVLGLSRLHALSVSRTELRGCRVWDIRYGAVPLYTLPCKVTSSSGRVEQLSRGARGGVAGSPAGKRWAREGRVPARREAWPGWRAWGEGGAGLSHAAALQLGAGEPSVEGSWEGRGCCIAGLRREAVRMEMCLCQGGCDTEEQCPAHPLICSSFPLIRFFHVLFRWSVSFIPYAVICLVQLRQ